MTRTYIPAYLLRRSTSTAASIIIPDAFVGEHHLIPRPNAIYSTCMKDKVSLLGGRPATLPSNPSSALVIRFVGPNVTHQRAQKFAGQLMVKARQMTF